ncbi:hypothetical protein VSU16_04610 [Cetobacterium somerae]|uniref:hypothetical protein n=1 Tax=Cetobacterium somerae TaxID=188913 RepID=UPI002E7B1738|nr:hypothetical protein [Cetobacterium somerae]WVJ02025.1 hypothetical protein VSU16_04610 [Cetobacterium somerae]
MYKEIFADFELPDPKLVEELRVRYKEIMTPENLAQIEELKKYISDNKEHFDYLKEMYEQLRSELTIFFPKEMSHPRELTKDQFEEEYESFQETENYSKLSEKIDKISSVTPNINKAALIKVVVPLVIFFNFDLNSVNFLGVLYKIIDIFKEKPDYLNAIDNMCYYFSKTFIVYNFMKYNSKVLKNMTTNVR